MLLEVVVVNPHIRSLEARDFVPLINIYKEGMDTGMATFETKIPDWEEWDSRYLKQLRYGLFQEETLLGWCALSSVSKREVYRGVAEVTIYVNPCAQGGGIGKVLLFHLIDASEKFGIWTLQAAIFPQNTRSIHLHQSCGFREVGVRKHIAQRKGVWFDNVLMERRSKLL